jgi:hypothetical protein
MVCFSRKDVPSRHKNRVLQSAELKEAVVQRESLEFMSHEAAEMRFPVSRTMDKVVGGERGCGLVAHLAYGEQLTWGQNNGARQQRCRRAVGETRVRALMPHSYALQGWRAEQA